MGRHGRKISRQRTRALHKAGIIQNYGPRPVQPKREMDRLGAKVLRILWRSKRTLVVWAARDVRQARALGGHAVQFHRFKSPLPGWTIGLWGRALVTLRGPR